VHWPTPDTSWSSGDHRRRDFAFQDFTQQLGTHRLAPTIT
jgi:hypothetical protein